MSVTVKTRGLKATWTEVGWVSDTPGFAAVLNFQMTSRHSVAAPLEVQVRYLADIWDLEILGEFPEDNSGDEELRVF